ncbi:MAG: helix-turn-helix domain-containing protein [Syntrophomonadaceae bacterium]|nr:helix-turn-helix domain-containing protein [Clostridia bacterium]
MDYITTEKWSSLEEIAEHLGVSKDTIYRWISTKQMPAHKVGKLWKFKISEIDKWVTKGEAADK